MRVITGTARGRKLAAPAGQDVRPTSAMVKESVFSMIQFEVEGARVLDLFAGSGQMGIEALSRGARECVFVDSSKQSLNALKSNLQSTGPWKNARVHPTDAISFLRGLGGQTFDIAFLDPPYGWGLFEQCLRLLAGHMSESGIIICEGDDETRLPKEIPPLSLKKQYKYGKTRIFHYRKMCG